MKKIILLSLLLSAVFVYSQEIELDKEFSLFTSQSAQGYFKPLVTTVGEGLNSGLYTTASYSNQWSFGFDFTFTNMYIPNSQKNFDAVLPDQFGNDGVTRTAEMRDGILTRSLSGTTKQPTVYGGKSNPIFAAPQNNFPPDSFYKTVSYVEGNNLNWMPGVPVAQIVAGLPTRTQLRLRFFAAPVLDETLLYYTIGVNQNIDRFFDLFEDESYALAANFAYHSLNRDPGIELNSWAAGLHFSKAFESGLNLYSGFQFEGLSGNFRAVKTELLESDVINSPYEEIRNGDPLDFALESFNSFRLTGGVSYTLGFAEFHADASYAAQPILKAGVTLWIMPNEDKFEMPQPAPAFIQESMPDVIASAIQYEQPVFQSIALEKPVKPIIPPVLKAQTQVYALIDSVRQPLTTLEVEEFAIDEMRALLPYIFFDEGSSELAARYNKLSAADTRYFTRDSIVGKSTLENYYHILNLIGSRLQQYDSAKVELIGCNSNFGDEKNNTQLSEARAQSVRDYLVYVWNIPTERITISKRNLPATPSNPSKPEGQEENRRVEIISDMWEVTAPIIIKDTVSSTNPQVLEFVSSVEAESGLRSWGLTVEDNYKPVAKFKGDQVLENSIVWEIDNDEKAKSVLRKNFDYYLEVNDNSNQYLSTETKSVPIKYTSVEDKRKASQSDTLFQKYNLILFKFDSSELGADNQRIVDVINKEINEESQVTVNGYTDIIGDEKYNQKLSTERAKSSAEFINAQDKKVIGWGESVLLYPNDLPEGRFYCRTVVVDVKTPVK